MSQFVPVADEVHRLFNVRDPEGDLFRMVSEKGHYAGRTQPTNTRQGIYAMAPNGVFLASINSNDPRAMGDMMERALRRWSQLSRGERLRAGDAAAETARVNRFEARYPEDGLVLRVFSRDLPREGQVAGWRRDAWNQDFLWYRRAEASSFIPHERRVGAVATVPEALVLRLARFNLVDNVRGQTPAFQPGEIRKAQMQTEIVAVAGDALTLKLTGETLADVTGEWSIDGFRDLDRPSRQRRGVHTHLSGEAVWDTKSHRFTRFDVGAKGTRWGATTYNGRNDDLAQAPVGYAIVLTQGRSSERVAPSFWYQYGW
jgi:hypothetical protein